jgi:hypothetical protein
MSMSHSDPNNLRDALLKQNGGPAAAAASSSVEEELRVLTDLAKAEDQRARKLMRWTIAVWSLWFLMLSVSLALPMIYAHLRAAPPPPATAPAIVNPPATNAATSTPPHGSAPGALIMILGPLAIALFFLLPPAGVLLLILMFLARRSANQTQIRASLASIDAQLRLLAAAAAQKTPPGGS